jgi:hypothetical protein
VPGEPLDLRRMSLAERGQGPLVAVLRSRDQDRVAQPLVDEDPSGTERSFDWTRLPKGRLHGWEIV